MFKKLLTLALAFCLTISLCSSALAEEPVRYLALGDSITTGYGLEDEDQGFTNILAASNGYELVNRAINGNTVVGLSSQMVSQQLRDEIAAADVITITCGGNDLMALLYVQVAEMYNASLPEGSDPVESSDIVSIMEDPASEAFKALLMATFTVLSGNEATGLLPFYETEYFQTGLESYIAGLNALVEGIYTINPDVTLIVATQYNPYQSFSGLYAKLNSGVGTGAQLLSQAIMDNASTAGYLVADVHAAFLASESNLCNAAMNPMNLDFHPNAEGHALIAETMQGVLDSIS